MRVLLGRQRLSSRISVQRRRHGKQPKPLLTLIALSWNRSLESLNTSLAPLLGASLLYGRSSTTTLTRASQLVRLFELCSLISSIFIISSRGKENFIARHLGGPSNRSCRKTYRPCGLRAHLSCLHRNRWVSGRMKASLAWRQNGISNYPPGDYYSSVKSI